MKQRSGRCTASYGARVRIQISKLQWDTGFLASPVFDRMHTSLLLTLELLFETYRLLSVRQEIVLGHLAGEETIAFEALGHK